MKCRKFNREMDLEPNEECYQFSGSCAGCPQPHIDTNKQIDAMMCAKFGKNWKARRDSGKLQPKYGLTRKEVEDEEN